MMHSGRSQTRRTVRALFTIRLRATTRAAQRKELMKFNADAKNLAKKYQGRVKAVTTLSGAYYP
jgi:hypothetical protein